MNTIFHAFGAGVAAFYALHNVLTPHWRDWKRAALGAAACGLLLSFAIKSLPA